MFKIGDKVRCINKKANPTSPLIINEIYTVRWIEHEEHDYLRLEGITSAWSDYQFELAEKRKKIVKEFGIVKFMKETTNV